MNATSTAPRIVRRTLGLTVTLATLTLAACSSTYRVAVISEPSGAMIEIDGQNVGGAPTTQSLNFGRQQTAVVRAALPGYFPEEIVLRSESPAVAKGELKLVLLEDQAWRVTTVSDATNSWLRVQVDDTIGGDDVWQKLVDSITDRYASLEQMDRASGYIRTIFNVQTFPGRVGTFQVRTRFICAIASRSPLVFKMKLEASFTNRRGDWLPYERVFTADAAMLEELQNRLGLK